jgi:hypothetical protein
MGSNDSGEGLKVSYEDTSDGLTARQRRAVVALVTNPTVEKAAQAIGIGRRQLHRYAQNPAFRAAVQNAHRELYEEALYKAHAAAASAISSLTGIVESPIAKNADRIGAARTILEQANRAAEKFDRRNAEDEERERKARDPMSIVSRRLSERLAFSMAREAGIPTAVLFPQE